MKNCYIEFGTPCTLQHDTTIRKRLHFITSNLTMDKNQIVLDFGTGLGMYAHHLSPQSGLYIGIDIEKENIRRAKYENKTKNIELISMSGENLGFKSDTFDIVIIIEVLEHIINDKNAINEIFRVLRPGGKLIVTAPNKLFPFETHGFRIKSKIYGMKGLGFPFLPYLPEIARKNVATARVYTPWHLRRILTDADFSIKKIGFLCPGMDQLKINFPKLARLIDYLQSILDHLENVPIFKTFLTTIIIYAEKDICI